MPRVVRTLLAPLVLLLVVSACGSSSSSTSSTTAVQLAGTSWTIDLGGLPPAVPGTATVTVAGTIPTEVVVTLKFATDTVSGFSGCNTFSGPYSTSSATGITIGPLQTTLIGCATQLMVVESAYTGQLVKAATYRIDGTTLLLSDAAGTVLLKFTKAA